MRIAHSVESHLVVSVIGRHCGHRSGHHGDSRERGGGRVIEVALACAVPGGSVEAGAAAAESLDSGGAAEGAAPGGGGRGDGGAFEAAAVAAESIHGAGAHSPATQSGPWRSLDVTWRAAAGGRHLSRGRTRNGVGATIWRTVRTVLRFGRGGGVVARRQEGESATRRLSRGRGGSDDGVARYHAGLLVARWLNRGRSLMLRRRLRRLAARSRSGWRRLLRLRPQRPGGSVPEGPT